MSEYFEGPDEDDPITLSPAVEQFLADPDTSPDVFSAVVAFLVDLRENPFPHLSMPVPGRPGMHSTPLRRDLGLVEYAVDETADPARIYVSRILRAD
ncbi:hypothetical protein GCM10018790_75690 [Kitasatospora xanthocidica]|uniref:hypothetical protein n=1 Tax=Kitasatospora xanthocidica TaxID=83382 RepID=UPI0016766724|nr:hypothetical protein [Kitasatospora xanthocidica]GHF87032.1 hypothetical protein GCM10018790_75690 [Kitasatospora xanthocidica]